MGFETIVRGQVMLADLSELHTASMEIAQCFFPSSFSTVQIAGTALGSHKKRM